MTHSFPTRRSSDLLGAIAVLEAEQQRPAGLVVAHHRTRPLERRRLGEAGAALIILAREAVSVAVGIEGEGKSAAPAQRIGNEGNRRPAGGAERALTLDQLAAAEAARRQHEIEDPLQRS